MSKKPGVRRGFMVTAVLAVAATPALFLAPLSEAEPTKDSEESWYLDAMKAVEAQEWSTGEGVTVAVIDTGVDAAHPDLEGRVLEGATVTEDGVEPGAAGDPDGHGTAMAGLIAGENDDGELTGVAPDSEILPVRIERREDGSLDQNLVYEGVRWAIDEGATVINLSLAGKPTADDDGWKRDLISYAVDNNAVIVAAVGNRTDFESEVGEPASIPGVLAVSGMGKDGAVWSGAVTGDAVVLCAPAEDVPHLRPGGGVQTASGTSAATALVSGTAALVRSRYPESTAGEVISRLINTAGDMGADAGDEGHGYGAVDAHAALTAAVAPSGDYYPLGMPEDVSEQGDSGRDLGGLYLGVSAGTVLAAGAGAMLWLLRRTRKPEAARADVAVDQHS